MRILSINQSPCMVQTNNYSKTNKSLEPKSLEKYNNLSGIYYPIFKSKIIDKPVQLSVELQKAFDSKDIKSKKSYFENLTSNSGLLLRNCSDEDYIKTVQILLDNIKYDKFEDKELFEAQMNLLSTSVRPNIGLGDYVNADKFRQNFKNFVYDDESVLNKINRVIKIISSQDTEVALDVNSHSKYPINLLSNFADTDFELDGVKIKSMEGFLQSLKTPNIKEQKHICSLDGLKAKGIGKKLNKRRNYDFKHLYWQGKKIDRTGREYKELLQSAYKKRFDNDDDFRFALEYTKGYKLTHNIGGDDPKRTLLTQNEFIEILDGLRENI